MVPTHLRTPETVLSFGGVNLSARQFLLLLLGAACSYDVWKTLEVLFTFPGGMFLAAGGALFPAVIACALAFGQIASRPLAAWMLVLLRYVFRPKCLVWRSVRFLEQEASWAEEDEKEKGEGENAHA